MVKRVQRRTAPKKGLSKRVQRRTASKKGLSPRLRRNAGALLNAHRASEVVKRSVISTAKKDLVMALVECAQQIINGKVNPTETQLRQLRHRSADIARLIDPATNVETKKKVLQKGGFIGAILGPLLGSLGKIFL